jgi:hypothetical protein
MSTDNLILGILDFGPIGGNVHQRCGDTGAHGDIEEYAEEREHLRRLAHEHIMHEYIEHQQNNVGDRPGYAAEERGQLPAD